MKVPVSCKPYIKYIFMLFSCQPVCQFNFHSQPGTLRGLRKIFPPYNNKLLPAIMRRPGFYASPRKMSFLLLCQFQEKSIDWHSLDIHVPIIKPPSNTECLLFSEYGKEFGWNSSCWILGTLPLGWRNNSMESYLKGRKIANKRLQHFWSDLRQGKNCLQVVVKQ